MNEGIKKFADLMDKDPVFLEKLKAAVESYTGEQTVEGIYTNVLAPLAEEYGISVSLEEFTAFVSPEDDEVMDDSEVAQISGGTSKGFGFGVSECAMIGLGAGGGAGKKSGGACVLVGAGYGKISCIAEGDSE